MQTIPRDHMSLGYEYGAFCTRSGDMYLKVPTKVPHIAIEFWSSFETPKSLSFTCPELFMSRFEGCAAAANEDDEAEARGGAR